MFSEGRKEMNDNYCIVSFICQILGIETHELVNKQNVCVLGSLLCSSVWCLPIFLEQYLLQFSVITD